MCDQVPESDAAMQPRLGNGEHILFVSGHFAPESTSGTHRSLHFAKALDDAGFRVTVLTVDRESLHSVDPGLDAIFPHEARILRVPRRATLETAYLNGKDIWRKIRGRSPAPRPSESAMASVAPDPAHFDNRIVLRHELSTLISFPDRFRGWHAPAVEAASRLAATDPIDAVFASGPPWTGLRVARDLARRLKCKLITDYRDPWTRNMGLIPTDEPRLYSALAERDEAEIIRKSDAVLFNSPGLLQNAQKSHGSGGASFHCLLNGTDVAARCEETPFSTSEPLVLRHLGSLYGGRSIDPIIRALANSEDIDSSRVIVDLTGADSASVAKYSRAGMAAGVAVTAHPSIPHSDATRLMSSPSVLVALQPAGFSAQIPTKVYEYLRTGNPVLVLASADSAAWKLASGFERCYRLDFSDEEWNRAVLSRLYQQWAQGRLKQVPTALDTASLSKAAIGQEFAKLVRSVLDGGQPAQVPRARSAPALWSNPQPASRR